MLTKFKHLHTKEVVTPYDPNMGLQENEGRSVAQLEYADAIGSLMYASHATRPDIAFAVSKLFLIYKQSGNYALESNQ